MRDLNKKRDLVLDVDNVEPEEISAVWGVLTRVAEGLALDGHEVSVRLYRWSDDDDGPHVTVSDSPVGEGGDLP